MEQFIKSILEKIIDNPDKLLITLTEHDDIIELMINVPQPDMGRVIGKGGRTINAIKHLANLFYAKKMRNTTNSAFEKRIFLKVEEV